MQAYEACRSRVTGTPWPGMPWQSERRRRWQWAPAGWLVWATPRQGAFFLFYLLVRSGQVRRSVHVLMHGLPRLRRCDALVGEVVRAPPSVAVVRLLDEMSDTVSEGVAGRPCVCCSQRLLVTSVHRLCRSHVVVAANAVSHPCSLPTPAHPPAPCCCGCPCCSFLPCCSFSCLPAAVPGAGCCRVLPQRARGPRVAAPGRAGVQGSKGSRRGSVRRRSCPNGAWAAFPPARIPSCPAFAAADNTAA